MKFKPGEQVICVEKISGLYKSNYGEVGIDPVNPKQGEFVTILRYHNDNAVFLKEYLRCGDGCLQTFREHLFKRPGEYIAEQVEKKVSEILQKHGIDV